MNPQTPATEKAKGLSLRLLLTAGLFLAALLLFGLIADEMVLEQEVRFDQMVFAAVRHLQSPGLTRVMTFITFFGSHYFLLPAYVLLILWAVIFRRNRTLSLDITAIGTLGTLIMFSLKSFFHRQRPPDALVHNVLGFSFPSGHSFSAFTFYGLLIYILWKQVPPWSYRWPVSILLFLWAAAIAFSRVYLRVHYPSDVVAGFCLCIVWLGVSFWLLRRLARHRGRLA
ncbi:MAG: phosphatase PAP2 family protein [Sphingobacteriales bacterium]|nr:MAG: phosphatase PAP2 family protein [Sphingobacteriales bacterium]